MTRAALALIAAILATAPAGAQTTQPQSADQDIVVEGEKQSWDPAEEKKKKVCKRSTATGSIMPKVTCRTKGEWDQLAERSLTEVERIKDDRVSRDNTQLARER